MVTGLLVGVSVRPLTVKLTATCSPYTTLCRSIDTEGGTDTSEPALLARLITIPCDGAGESRLTEKPLRSMPTATVPILRQAIDGRVTDTGLDETLVNPSAVRLTMYWPVRLGVL